MIPDYRVFIRYQDRRLLPFIYLIFFILGGSYWNNCGGLLTPANAAGFSGVLAVVLFHLIRDLKAYWMYKIVMKTVDLSLFTGQSISRGERLWACPLAACLFAACSGGAISWWLLTFMQGAWAVAGLSLLLPAGAYLMFKTVRPIAIKLLGSYRRERVQYRRLAHYAGVVVLVNGALTLLTVLPLRSNPDFSLHDGWLTARLTVAMFTLCMAALAINLLLAWPSKRYIFLGKLFLQEIDFFFSPEVPCATLYAQPLLVRWLLYALLQLVWILMINVLLALLAWRPPFGLYFLLCYLPAGAYYFLHLCWRWHRDYLDACDMYLRNHEIEKRAPLW